MGPECSNYHTGSGLCIIAKGHPHQLHRALNNTEVKESNSTIYRHAISLCNIMATETIGNRNAFSRFNKFKLNKIL